MKSQNYCLRSDIKIPVSTDLDNRGIATLGKTGYHQERKNSKQKDKLHLLCESDEALRKRGRRQGFYPPSPERHLDPRLIVIIRNTS